MKLKQESAYGIQGLLVMAACPPAKIMLLSDIAAKAGVPQAFLAKIYQKLTRHGIVRSFRGATRGYALMRPTREITLKEILLAIEGPDLFERCIFWSERCSDINPCPLHNQWRPSSQQFIEALMQRTTLHDLMSNAPVGIEGDTCSLLQDASEPEEAS